MVFCVRCGKKNLDQANFCYNCGAAIVFSPAGVPAPASASGVAIQPSPPTGYPVPPAPAPVQLPGWSQPALSPAPNLPPLPKDAPLLKLHPLAQGAAGLPPEVLLYPARFYSYVNQQNRLTFAHRAGFWKRAGAALVDMVVVFVPYSILTTIITALAAPELVNSRRSLFDNPSRSEVSPVVSGLILLSALVIFFGYFYLTGIATGQTLGKRAANLRVIKLDGNKPDRMTALLRFVLGYMLSTNLVVLSISVVIFSVALSNPVLAVLAGLLTFGWGFWWAGWDELGQSWHDKLARTLVVDTREYIEGIHFSFPVQPPE